MSVPSRSPADDTSSSLLLRVKNSESDAWLQLVNWIGPSILGWCQRARLQPAEIDDVSQHVLQNIWAHLPSFRKDQPNHSFRGWVYTMTRNQIADLRRQSALRGLPQVELPVEPDASEAASLLQRAQAVVLQELVAQNAGDAGFKAFYRTAVDGLSASAAADELGLKEWTVRQHRSRWIKRLRDRLHNEFEELLS
jgi:RNA polymerase sigma-70 factor (ECF subfamily)